MKKTIWITLGALLVCGVALAGQLSTTWTLRNVVDPPDLRDGLNADAQAADARLDALEGGSTVGAVEPGYIIVGNASTVGVDVAVSGDITMATNGAVALAADCVAAAEMADADHGDVSWSGGVATVDTGAVLASEIGAGTLANTVLLPTSVTWTNTQAIVIDGTTAVTSNQTFLSSTGVTNTLVIVDGLIKAIN